MAHVEPTHLMRLALGNDASSDDAGALRHIAVCDRCRDELNRTRRVVVAARTVEASDLPTAPPERVWQHITHELCRTREPAPPPAAGVLPHHRAEAADEHRADRSRTPGNPTHHLALGLLVGTAVWWTRRVRSRRSGRSD
ncbi:hypothetical protein GCM10010346_56610 [Streptomyces chryseus]|uniref:Zinc-finger domain-containing protein n=1 Tax=Streptomyces chryseus TaxID=68186 RepID=A0ABQ3E7B0_9ACTN|nr:hypothetical protein GCM10010346_56610 [Streptomyces chryseus]